MKIIAIIFFAASFVCSQAAEPLVDKQLAQKALLVLRVKLQFAADTSPKTPFTYYYVHNIQEFKNDLNYRVADICVLGFKGRPGVPKEECTIYVQTYDRVNNRFTMNKDLGPFVLVGGDATNGVSHVSTTGKL
jgi:hypothetical protein